MMDILSLRQAIRTTLHYFDLLDFPLTTGEIEEYLYGWSAPAQSIKEELLQMSGDVSHLHGYYFLSGRQNIAELRKERKQIAHNLWKRVRKFSWIFDLCPFVKMVAVSNSLSYNNAKPSSDIDLFIMTDAGRLWLARLFMKLLTQAAGMRVHHDKVAGRFCLSFFVSEGAANLAAVAYDFDPHLAYFVLHMRPVYEQKGAYEKFLAANQAWTAKYFKRPLNNNSKYIYPNSRPLLVAKKIIEGFCRIFGNLLERLAYSLQIKKDKTRKKFFDENSSGRASHVVLTHDMFKFHERDRREEISRAFH